MNKFTDNFKSQKQVRIDKLDDMVKTNRGSPSVTMVRETEVIEKVSRENPKQNNRDRSRKREKEHIRSRHRDTSDDHLEEIYDEENRKHRRRSKNRAYFNPILGDNVILRKPTRTYINYRQPFDWYDMNRCEILDEYEEAYEPEPPVYSHIYSYLSPSYDRLERYDSDRDRRSTSRRRYRGNREQSSGTESDYSKPRGIMKKEVKKDANLFAFSDGEEKNVHKSRPRRQKCEQSRDLSEFSENFSELSIEERKSSKRY